MSGLEEREADLTAGGGDPVPDVDPFAQSAPQGARDYLKLAVLAVVLLAALALLYMTPAKEIVRDLGSFKERISSFGWAAPLVFMAAVAVGVAAGVPRLLFCPIGGAIFGFAAGLLWTQAATLLGSYATFLFVRWGGRAYVLRRWPRLCDMSRRFSDRGAVSVFLIRQIPISGFWLNALLGLTHARHRDFIVGTIIGSLPEAIPITLVGASASQASQDSFGRALYYILAAMVWFVILGIMVRRFVRSSRFQAFKAWGKAQGKTGEAENVLNEE